MTTCYSLNADIETVFKLLTDPDFLVNRCVDLGSTDIQCDVEVDGNKTQVTLTRTFTRDLPAILKKLFGNENTTMMVEHWEEEEGKKTGSYVVTVEGQPVTLKANFELVASKDGCKYNIDFSCKAKIPLVGKKVEKFILSQTEEGVIQELDYLQEKLT